MNDAAFPATTVAARTDTLVVLVTPDALGADWDRAALHRTLAPASCAVRVLLCLPDATDLSLLDALAEAGVDTEILLGPVPQPPTCAARVVCMPPGSEPGEQTALALALSDVLLAVPAPPDTPLLSLANARRVQIVTLGGALPNLPDAVGVAHRLDPEVRGWHARGRSLFGRFEQFMLELLALNWLGDDPDDNPKARKQMRKCVRGPWRPASYFPEPTRRRRPPDPGLLDPTAPIRARFEALDRSALHGSFMHRDLVWVVHLGAALAVLFAVAGELNPQGSGWGLAELVLLIIVALLIFASRHAKLLDRWTACRFGAEQLRIALMCLPMMVVPPVLTSEEPPYDKTEPEQRAIEFGFQAQALAEVKRAVRDQGLPRVDPACSPVQAARWLHLIVRDQRCYHHRNRRKLGRAEEKLEAVTKVLFITAIVAVCLHLFLRLVADKEMEWLLLFTAAGPAFAAAFHGAETRLGIAHRKALSRDAERELAKIGNDIAKLIVKPPAPATAWQRVRHLTLQAAEAMGRENTSWHGLVRRERDILP